MGFNLNTVKAYIQNDLNILVSGKAGTGKTYILEQACAELGLKMKYFSAPTLDPWTQLTGIPVPNPETETIKFFRPHDIDTAEVIFVDEINRADPRVKNACFEWIQFGTINGEKLPKLKCVVAAMNPDDGDYDVEPLDPALLDRFDVYLTAEAKISYPYFRAKYNEAVASSVLSWWNEHNSNYLTNQKRASKGNSLVYISPRRMDKVVAAFQAVPLEATLVDAMPPESVINVKALYAELKEAFRPKTSTPAEAPASSNASVQELLTYTPDKLRSGKSVEAIRKVLEDETISTPEKMPLLNALAGALSTNMGVKRLFATWSFAIERMSNSHIRIMTREWPKAKSTEFQAYYAALATA